MSRARDTSAPDPLSKQLYLPDFCRARAVLAIVIICELTALVLALARNEAVLGFWPDLARTSMFLLWIGLFGAASLCGLRGYLNRQSVGKGSALVLTLTAALSP
jgi:two-component system sensor histidine kinase AlgZ